MGKKTYTELCLAFGLAVPARAPQTLNAQLAQAQARIAELEQELKKINKRIEMQTYALERIRDIEWSQYSNRIDAIQQLAKHALQ
jgi:TolA-binding protein